MKNNIDEKLMEKIIRTAYGDANIIEKLFVKLKAKNNPEVKKLFDDYRKTASAVRNIPLFKYPEHQVNNTLKKMKITPVKEKSYLLDFVWLIAKRPLLSSATFAIVIASFVTVFWANRANMEQQYSKAEIVLAEQQVKESLNIVGRVLKRTQLKVEEEIINERVKEPLHKSFNIINNLFIGG